MEERENILNYLKDKVLEITEDNGYPITIRTSTRQYKPYDLYEPFELPAIHVVDGTERRTYEGKRVLHHFNVILRVVVYDEEHVSSDLNKVIDSITRLLEEDLFLGGNVILPIYIDSVETDEGWLAPYAMCDVSVATVYSRLELNR